MVAFLAGTACVVLSYLLILSKQNPIVRLILRDLLTIVGLGVLLPVAWIELNGLSFSQFGLSSQNWFYAILANVVLASLLAVMFYKEAKGKGHKTDFSGKYGTVFYLMVGVLFETLFFYSFLRQLFEFSFGIIPALLLTSAFYSLHHIGLEEQMSGTSRKKELINLFFVGLMYSITFRVFNSALAIFPFFIGVGVVSDLIVEKQTHRLSWRKGLLSLSLMILSAILLIYL
jgi:hypothetical protein